MIEQRFSFRAMNTEVELLMEMEREEQQEAVQTAFADVRYLFQQIEATCSRFLPDSELSQLNRANEAEFSASPLLFEVLLVALAAYQTTDGIYHPGLLAHLEAAGYDRSREWLHDSPEETLCLPQPVGTAQPFALDKRQRIVRLTPGMKIDLGGIAKGFAVDRAVEHLQQLGAGLVNAGGDLRTFGGADSAHPAHPWYIGVEDPFSPDRDLGILTVAKGAVATSTSWKRRWKKGSVWMHHLIDPRTGRPAISDVVATTVLAPTATQADVLAKTTLLLGLNEGADWIAAQGHQAVLVGHNREVRRVGCELV